MSGQLASETALPLAGSQPVAARDEGVPDYIEAQAFWRMRARIARTLLRQGLTRARFRVSLILVLSALLWATLFILCLEGFRFLRFTISSQPLMDQTLRAIFGLFFASLMMMLVFSSGVILYGFLFRTREIAFLLTTPARPERVFLHKFQEAVLLSSWGFLLLGSPMLVAYGLTAAAPWYYYAILGPLMVAFVYIPAAIGGMLCLGLTYLLPGRWLHALATLVGLGLVAGGWLIWSSLAMPTASTLTPEWFQDVLERLHFTEGRLLPNWWLSSGLLEAARHEWAESVMFLVVMVSNALFARQLAIWTAGATYRRAYHELHGHSHARHSSLAVALMRGFTAMARRVDRFVERGLIVLPLPIRLLMVKDLRLFRRDAVQWSQFLIFIALLALYFVNIPRLSYNAHYAAWINMVSFLNLSVVGLLLSTFTTRFIFPMISLEGRRFWMLGLLPLKRDTILWSKFWFAIIGSLIPSSLLILLSDAMLGVSRLVTLSHQLTCLLLCVGLAGIAVGLGARLPDLRQQSPTRIAAGFGGTLALVLSTLYILAVVLLTAIPCHLHLASDATYVALFDRHGGVAAWFRVWFWAGTGASVLLGGVATAWPMWIGLRAFRRMEF